MAELITKDSGANECLLIKNEDDSVDGELIASLQENCRRDCSVELLHVENRRSKKKWRDLQQFCQYGSEKMLHEGWLPLHYAARYGCNWNYLQFIYEVYPAAASIKTAQEFATPYELLLQNKAVIRDPTIAEEVCRRCPLFNRVESVAIPIDESESAEEATAVAVFEPISLGEVRSIARTEASHGQYPLHILCRNPCTPTEEIQEMVSAFPAAASMMTTYGWYPLHIICRNSDDAVAIGLVLRAYPRAAQAITPDGWLPLHQICRYSHSLEAIRIVFEAYPAGAKIRTKKGTLALDIFSRWYPMDSRDKDEMHSHDSYVHVARAVLSQSHQASPLASAQVTGVVTATPVNGHVTEAGMTYEEVLCMLVASEG